MSRQEIKSIKESIPYFLALFLLLILALYSYAAYDFSGNTVLSRVSYDQHVGNVRLYQYRIAAATATWYSDVIPLNGAKKCSVTIFEATGNLTADWTGTLGTGDFYLYGKTGASVDFPAPAVAGVTIPATNAMIKVPMKYGEKAPLAAGKFVLGTTTIDVYGRHFYDLEELGGLTHIQLWGTTNNVDNSVIIGLE